MRLQPREAPGVAIVSRQNFQAHERFWERTIKWCNDEPTWRGFPYDWYLYSASEWGRELYEFGAVGDFHTETVKAVPWYWPWKRKRYLVDEDRFYWFDHEVEK